MTTFIRKSIIPAMRSAIALALLATLAGCASLKPVQVVEVSGPKSLLTNEDARFNASIAPEATQPVSTVWNFGDGTTADGMSVEHSYSVPGDYEVTFTASNRKGSKTSSDTRTLDVVVKEPIRAPAIVSIDYRPRTVDTQSSVVFSADVRDDARVVTGYEWSAGMGVTSTQKSFSHTFAEPGKYEVGLTVRNSAGADSRSITVDVHPYEAEVCRDLTDLNPAFFDRNSSELPAGSRSVLTENLEILKVCPNTCVTISGYVDPNERRADELSAARAHAVEAFYVAGGVPASRIEAHGKGRVSRVSRKEGLAQFRRADSVPSRCVPGTNTSY